MGGLRLALATRTVQLPPDVYVVGSGISDYFPGPGPPPAADADTELVTLQRGRSLIHLGIPSGRILREEPAPGEEGAFDFLNAALR